VVVSHTQALIATRFISPTAAGNGRWQQIQRPQKPGAAPETEARAAVCGQ